MKNVFRKVSKTLAKMQRNRLGIYNFTRNDINHKYFDFFQKRFYLDYKSTPFIIL